MARAHQSKQNRPPPNPSPPSAPVAAAQLTRRSEELHTHTVNLENLVSQLFNGWEAGGADAGEAEP